jgi:formate dehydrogenase assembly factor FdhD
MMKILNIFVLFFIISTNSIAGMNFSNIKKLTTDESMKSEEKKIFEKYGQLNNALSKLKKLINEDGCPICGKHHVNSNFHHVEPENKKYSVSKARTWEAMKEELLKTISICEKCHAEIHSVSINAKQKVFKYYAIIDESKELIRISLAEFIKDLDRGLICIDEMKTTGI